MFNFFDISVIPTFLSSFNVEKILVIGLSNKLLLNEVLSFNADKKCSICAIDSKIDISDLILELDTAIDNLEKNITYFSEDSLNVLPTLDKFDAVFINDDPNWYTVYNELNIIKKNNPLFPMVFICNNKYPHKRRDSYSNPDKIPKEFRNECCNDLPIVYEENNEIKHTMVKDGFCHAINKDTPKNGVLTAIEDFLNQNPSLKLLDINPLEGITLIYQPSEIIDFRIDKILNEELEHDFSLSDLSDKFIENDILLKHVAKINSLKDELDRVNEFKSEIEYKNTQLKKYKEQISLKDSEIKYKDSKIINVGSQISLSETKLQSAEAKLLKKDNELKAKELELSSKETEIRSKEKEIKNINSQLLTKENELETIKNRLISLESNFLENVKKLEINESYKSNAMQEANDEINSLKNKLKQKDAQIKSTNRRLNALKYEYIKSNTNSETFKQNNDDTVIQKNPANRGILSPLSMLYIIVNSKSNEVRINLKLYNALKKSNCFDEGYYLNKYSDIAESKWCKYFSPQLHYVCIGFDENRKISKESPKIENKKELLEYVQNK